MAGQRLKSRHGLPISAAGIEQRNGDWPYSGNQSRRSSAGEAGGNAGAGGF